MRQPNSLVRITASEWKLMQRHSSALQKRPSRLETRAVPHLPLQCHPLLITEPHPQALAMPASASSSPGVWSWLFPLLRILVLQFQWPAFHHCTAHARPCAALLARAAHPPSERVHILHPTYSHIDANLGTELKFPKGRGLLCPPLWTSTWHTAGANKHGLSGGRHGVVSHPQTLQCWSSLVT